MGKRKGEKLASTRLFRQIEGQDNMFDKSVEQEVEESKNTTVTCLGIKFENDEVRRRYFLEKLREKLRDPEFRKIEGFPTGTDDDILALSDPPYFTACPNPWIPKYIEEWEKNKSDKTEPYQREPFAADVSEGKSDPIYNAHTYHTKVPHKAIMRYMLHYTNPGDVVYDGFCGTGMTGVAAQLCGDKLAVMDLGYQVKSDGNIYQEEINETGKKVWKAFSKLGIRHSILNDLSPVATFIASNYNTPLNLSAFEKDAQRILQEVEEECGWMYETLHEDGKSKGKINFTVWSDVFICPECSKEIIFWDSAVNKVTGKVYDEFPCPNCNSVLNKRKMDRAWISQYDFGLNKIQRIAKQVPVLINYFIGKKKYEKIPDASDLSLLKKIESMNIPYWFPIAEIPNGFNTRQPKASHGITHVHQFYTKRNLWILAAIRNRCKNNSSILLFNSQLINISRLNRYRPGVSFPYNPLNGTLYVGSQISEASIFIAYRNKLNKLARAFKNINIPNLISTKSTTDVNNFTVDYIFVDPPFGANINYSELNFLWESWLKVWTNNKTEAIENDVQRKGINEYRQLMTSCFKELYHTLKPGRWMTVEFSNTKASVWNSIQTALLEAGFIVANVSILDKQQGSFKAVTTPTAVKQDLVISAYKPNGGFEERFQNEAETEDGVWDFIRTHLRYLPVIKQQNRILQVIPERDARILFDQMVAYYIRKGFQVPISSQEFQMGLVSRFIERDGMYFLPEQTAEYDRKKMLFGELEQLNIFVSDEASAIQWIRQLIKLKPQTFAEINPQFMQQLGGWNKNEALLDLRELLSQNFLNYDGRGSVPEQIHSYLSSNWKDLRNLPKDNHALVAKAKDRWYVPDPNKAIDLEKLREKTLLKEFWDYLPVGYNIEKVNPNIIYLPTLEPKPKTIASGKKLKIMRIEALRVGFKYCWQNKDYKTIIAVANRIPEDVLQEDPKLIMWYDQAKTRLGED